MVDDEKYMAMALELAAHAKGNTSPNPMVGAVLVKNGKIIGTGFHPRAGEPHAEVFALDAAGKAAVGATLYVSLEPCSHTGKTPPCTQRIIAAGVREVVVAMQDPNPLVNGQGLLQLATAGMITRSGVLQLQAQRLNEVFIKHITTERPFVTMKAAMTLDGKIATRTKASRWITNERSREFAHRLRHENDAIMVGIGTVLADNPSLTTRLPEDGRNALRIIVDSRAQTPITATVVQNNPENTILMVTDAADFQRVNRLQQEGVDVRVFPADEQGRVPLTAMMNELGRRHITSVLVEGGSTLNYSLLTARLVDKIHFFVAPLIFGGESAATPVGGEGVATVAQAWRVINIESTHYETDLLVTGYIEYS